MTQTKILTGLTTATIMTMLSGMAIAQNNNGVQINTDAFGDNMVGDAANEPSFAISPVDPDVLVTGWRQFDTINSDVRYAGFAYSWDGGKTWTNGGVLEPPPGSGNANQSDPVLAADLNGSFFYNSLIFRSSKDGQTVYRSDDDGVSWGTPVYIETGFLDKNWYAINQSGISDHHYCIWGNYEIGFHRSTDEGQSWSNPSILGYGISSWVGFGADAEVFAGWWEYWNDKIVIRRSDNAKYSGQTPTFGPERSLYFGAWPWNLYVNPAGGAGQLYIEADKSGGPNHGNVYALSSAVPNDDVCEVMFARSTDNGDSWSSPMRVNDDVDPQGNDYQWMAAMSITPAGRLDTVWFDTRDDPGHFMSRLYYSYSYDGGLTWAENRPLSDAFDPWLGWPNQEKIGDYFQCLSDNGATNIIYPATFNGEQDIYFLRTHPIVLDVDPLIAGQYATFEITGAKPNETAWLAYSTVGEGRTFVPQLNVNVELTNPKQAGSSQTTDSNGDATWVLNVPPQGSGVEVWIQALQVENASNIVQQTIQ